MSDTNSQLRRDLVLIFALGLLFRLALLILFPVPYGNDAAGRLYFRDSIFTWHWLPLTQALVYLPYVITQNVFIVRLIFAIAGSLAAVALAFHLQTFASRRAAFIGGVLIAINAHAVFLSLMPYQEVVFLGLVFGSLAFFTREKNALYPRRSFVIGSVLYGLACLTRYEAWFILPALFVVGIWPAVPTRRLYIIVKSVTKNFAGLGWGPALWLLINWLQWNSPTAFLFHRADHAFYAWSPHGEIVRISAYIGNMLYWLLRFGSPLILFALPGIWVFWKKRQTFFPILWPVLLLLMLVLSFLVFVAGNEFATANRFAMIPLGILLVFAALGMDDVLARLPQSSHAAMQKLLQPVHKTVAPGALLIFLLIYGAVPVVQANRAAVHREPYEVATFLKNHLAHNESAVIVATSYEGEVPMPYQRIFGQLNFDKDRLFCSFFIEPQNIKTFLTQRNLRYIILWRDELSSPDSGSLFRRAVAETGNKSKVVFANNGAVIYECIPL